MTGKAQALDCADAQPGCGEGPALPHASLVLRCRRFCLWFLSFVLPAVGEREAGDVISYL